MDGQILENARWCWARAWRGLLAAQVLADGYGQVTVIDRDELPEGIDAPARRPGRHLHALAARGQQALEELFCGLTAERLVADGVPAGDMLADTRLFYQRSPAPAGADRAGAAVRQPASPRRPRARRVPGAPQRAPRRPLRRGRAGHDAPIVAASPGPACSAGPTAAPRCSLPTWWSTPPAVIAPRRGWRPWRPRPPAAQVRVGLGYATRIYRLPPMPSAATWRSCRRPPRHPRAGALQLLEGDRGMR